MKRAKIWYNGLPDNHIIKHKHKRRLLLSSVGLLAISTIVLTSNHPTSRNEVIPNPIRNDPQTRYHASEVVVKFKKSDPQIASSFIQNPPLSYTTRYQPLRLRNNILSSQPLFDPTNPEAKKYYKMSVPFYANPEQVASDFEKSDLVEYAEPDLQVSASMIPNDPYFASSRSWGQSYDDLWGLKKIKSPQAWDKVTGSTNLVVAVVDTGLDYNHQDLAQNVWVNSDENPSNGLDNDNNSYINDYRGYNFYAENNNITDDHGHGTHVAGTIAAMTNNSVGVAGTNWTTKIMGLKFLSSSGYGYSSDGARAIRYAADNGAKIINCSWGGSGYSQILADAVNYAYSKGVLVIAAGGNSGSSARNFTPASLNHVVSVGATDYNDQRPSWSNYDITISAPGSSILSLRATGTSMGTVVGSYYSVASGTSMATPHVAGLAALILTKNTGLNIDRVVEFIKRSADDIGTPGNDPYFGYGRINADTAVSLNPLHPDGTLLNGRGTPQVYLIESQKKRPIPSWPIFAQRYNVSEIIYTDVAEMSNYEDDTALTYMDGSLVYTQGDPKIYFIEDTKRRWITSAEVFNRLGLNWREVKRITSSEMSQFSQGQDLNSWITHPNGSLVYADGDPKVYYLDEGGKRWVRSYPVYINRFKNRTFSKISQGELAGYPTGSNQGFRDGTLLASKTGPNVYVLEHGLKRWVTSGSVFTAMGYSWNNIIFITQSELDEYQSGSDLL